MFLRVESDNGLPVYEQIVRQVKFAIANGALTGGELLPSVRELARELAINPNTVARAYRQLQDDGIVETVRGTGLAVSPAAKRACQQDRRKLLSVRLGQALAEALQAGLDSAEVEKLVATELRRLERTSRG